MKNLFKKILACCLVVCMVFTLCISALTVSAEEFDGELAITVNGTVTTESTEAVVSYTASVEDHTVAGIAAAKVDVAVPAGLTITKLEIVTNEAKAAIEFASNEDPTGEPISLDRIRKDYVGAPYVNNGVFTYILWCFANDAIVLTDDVTLKITYTGAFTVPATYPLSAEVEACRDDIDFINLEEKGANLVIEEAGCKHTETEEIPAVPATCTTAGSTAGVKCSDCQEVLTAPETVEALGHTILYSDGDDEDHHTKYCSKCDYSEQEVHNFGETGTCVCGAVEKVACEHATLLENRTVEFVDDSMVYNTVCATCGEIVDSEIDDSEDAATVENAISTVESYGAVEDLDGGTVVLEYALPANRDKDDIWLAYIDGSNVITGSKRTDTLAYNEITFVSYSDDILTLTVSDDFSGVVVAYTLSDGDDIVDLFDVATKTTALILESNISYNFKLSQAPLQISSKEVFDSFYAVLTHEQYTPNVANSVAFVEETKVPATAYEDLYDTDKGKFHVFEYAVSAMQLGDLIDCEYYAVRNGISYLVRVEMDYSSVNYCTGSNGFDRGRNAALKTLLADMLVYGAEAQKYFLYNEKNLITSNPVVSSGIEEYRTKGEVDFSKYSEVPESISNMMPSNSSKKLVLGKQALELKDKVEVWLQLSLSNFISQYEEDALNDLTLRLKYYDGKNNLKIKDYKISDTTFSSGLYILKCSTIIPTKFDSQIDLEIYYNDMEKPIAVRYYSVNTYLTKNANSDFVPTYPSGDKAQTDTASLCIAIAKYGNASVNCFPG